MTTICSIRGPDRAYCCHCRFRGPKIAISKWLFLSEQVNPQRAKDRYRLYHVYGAEKMDRAYQLWLEGVSVYKASILTGVPEQTLRDRTKSCGFVSPEKHHSGKDRMLSPQEEASLVNHIKFVASVGYGYTRRDIAELAGVTSFYLQKKPSDDAYSDKWVYHFLLRWPELKVTNPKALD